MGPCTGGSTTTTATRSAAISNGKAARTVRSASALSFQATAMRFGMLRSSAPSGITRTGTCAPNKAPSITAS